MRALTILYEDADVIVVDKPAGVVVHPTYRNTSGTLLDDIRLRVPQARIVGRLDKLTSGIVVAAKSAESHAALQGALAASDAEKEYLALVYGDVDRAHGEIDLRLRVSPADRRFVVASTAGAPSLTRFERLAYAPAPRVGLSLLRCRLVTGRRHQIRVHLAASGWPVVGDSTYGEPRWRDVDDQALADRLRDFPRQALHASRAAFTHPSTGARLSIECAPPDDFAALLAASLPGARRR